MAPVKPLNGKALLVQIGDGSTPTEVFTHDCLINTERGIEFSSNANTELLPDCDIPTEPGWTTINVDELSAAINGAGTLHTPSVKFWFEWYRSGLAKNVRVKMNDIVLADGGGYWQGAFKVTTFSVTGPGNVSSTASVTLQSTGEVDWVDAAA
jgi:hypothetical protein